MPPRKKADVTEDTTVYDQIVDLTGLKFDPDGEDTIDDYKRSVVQYFDDKYEDDSDAFYKLAEPITSWVDLMTKVAKKNRGAHNKMPLPTLAGLDDEYEEAEAAPKAKAKGKSSAKSAEPDPPSGKTAAAKKKEDAATATASKKKTKAAAPVDDDNDDDVKKKRLR